MRSSHSYVVIPGSSKRNDSIGCPESQVWDEIGICRCADLMKAG
jgi:hypothetical protein